MSPPADSDSTRQSQPRVSVLMLTYNQENYIGAALESALMQSTTFDYEVVIGEDRSTDRTREIVAEFAARHPNKIRAFLREANLGSMRNLADVLSHCRGELVAFLEGDDYWTSPDKLQKQVDFLDAHPECALCFHNATVVWEGARHVPIPYNSPAQEPITTITDLWRTNFIASCTVMWRRQLLGQLPEWFFKLPYGDWALHMLCAQHGQIGYIGEVLGVYRVHGAGIWSQLDTVEQLQAWIAFYQIMNANLQFRYNDVAEPIIAARQKEVGTARRMAEIVQRSVPAGAVILVMTDKRIRQFRGFESRYFPDRSGRKTQQVFASGSSGSAEASWILPRAVYDFRLYSSAARDVLLASVKVTQERSVGRIESVEPQVYKPGAFIKATPNPVAAAGHPGNTTITWNTGDGSAGVVDVVVDDQRLHYPSDGVEAIQHLESLRAAGGQFLLIPQEAFDLLQRYPNFEQYFRQQYRKLAEDPEICLLYDLQQQVA